MKQQLNSLETQRLWLRKMESSDLPFISKTLADPRMTQFIGSGAAQWTPEKWMARTFERQEQDGLSFLAVELKPGHEFVGQVGLLLQEVEGKKEVEVGYHILPEHWGKGYA